MLIYKNIILIFPLVGIVVFLLSCFTIYKNVDNECSTGNYKSLKISIGEVIKNPEMIRFVPDHLKTKKCVNMQLKIAIRKAFIENGGTLKFLPESYTNQKMYNQVVDNYADALNYVPIVIQLKKMCNEVVDSNPSANNLFLNALKLKKCMIKLFTLLHFHFILFLIDIRLKKILP